MFSCSGNTNKKTKEESIKEVIEAKPNLTNEQIKNLFTASLKTSYSISEDYYTDFNNDGLNDYIVIYENDSEFFLGYAISRKDNSQDYETHVIKNLMPSSRKLDQEGKPSYAPIKMEVNGNTFTITYITYIWDDSMIDSYIDRFRLDMQFEYIPLQETFQLIKYGGLNVSEDGEHHINLKEICNPPIYITNWDWYYSMKFLLPLQIAKDTVIPVNNEKEFLEALGNNREICIETPVLNLTLDSIKHYITDNCPYISRSYLENGDLVLKNLNNFIIRGDRTKIVVDNLQEHVVFLDSCSNIYIEDLWFTHDVPAGDCQAGVFYCKETTGLVINGCTFDGSGTIGMDISNSKNISVTNSRFCRNSRNVISVSKSDSIRFYNCDISENKTLFSVIENNYSSLRFGKTSVYHNTIEYQNYPFIDIKMAVPEKGEYSGRTEFIDFTLYGMNTEEELDRKPIRVSKNTYYNSILEIELDYIPTDYLDISPETFDNYYYNK